MKKVIVTSLNPVKISAVEIAFKQVFPNEAMEFEGISVASEVSDQPLTSEETLLGARNRIKNAKQKRDADFYVGIEAGLEAPFTFAWIIIESDNKVGESRSASLPLPSVIIEALTQGEELGHVMDRLFNQENIKQKGGAMGVLTNDLLTRSMVYQQALIMALVPFVHQNLYI